MDQKNIYTQYQQGISVKYHLNPTKSNPKQSLPKNAKKSFLRHRHANKLSKKLISNPTSEEITSSIDRFIDPSSTLCIEYQNLGDILTFEQGNVFPTHAYSSKSQSTSSNYVHSTCSSHMVPRVRTMEETHDCKQQHYQREDEDDSMTTIPSEYRKLMGSYDQNQHDENSSIGVFPSLRKVMNLHEEINHENHQQDNNNNNVDDNITTTTTTVSLSFTTDPNTQEHQKQDQVDNKLYINNLLQLPEFKFLQDIDGLDELSNTSDITILSSVALTKQRNKIQQRLDRLQQKKDRLKSHLSSLDESFIEGQLVFPTSSSGRITISSSSSFDDNNLPISSNPSYTKTFLEAIETIASIVIHPASKSLLPNDEDRIQDFISNNTKVIKTSLRLESTSPTKRIDDGIIGQDRTNDLSNMNSSALSRISDSDSPSSNSSPTNKNVYKKDPSSSSIIKPVRVTEQKSSTLTIPELVLSTPQRINPFSPIILSTQRNNLKSTAKSTPTTTSAVTTMLNSPNRTIDTFSPDTKLNINREIHNGTLDTYYRIDEEETTKQRQNLMNELHEFVIKHKLLRQFEDIRLISKFDAMKDENQIEQHMTQLLTQHRLRNRDMDENIRITLDLLAQASTTTSTTTTTTTLPLTSRDRDLRTVSGVLGTSTEPGPSTALTGGSLLPQTKPITIVQDNGIGWGEYPSNVKDMMTSSILGRGKFACVYSAQMKLKDTKLMQSVLDAHKYIDPRQNRTKNNTTHSNSHTSNISNVSNPIYTSIKQPKTTNDLMNGSNNNSSSIGDNQEKRLRKDQSSSSTVKKPYMSPTASLLSSVAMSNRNLFLPPILTIHSSNMNSNSNNGHVSNSSQSQSSTYSSNHHGNDTMNGINAVDVLPMPIEEGEEGMNSSYNSPHIVSHHNTDSINKPIERNRPPSITDNNNNNNNYYRQHFLYLRDMIENPFTPRQASLIPRAKTIAIKIAQYLGNTITQTPTTSVSNNDTIEKSNHEMVDLPPLACTQEFLREVKALTALVHPNIIRMEGVILKPLSIIVELIHGSDLATCLKENDSNGWQKNTSPMLRQQFLLDISSAISHMHSKCYLHRDIKSHNIMIHEYSSGQYVAKLSDFGTAILLQHPPRLKNIASDNNNSIPSIPTSTRRSYSVRNRTFGYNNSGSMLSPRYNNNQLGVGGVGYNIREDSIGSADNNSVGSYSSLGPIIGTKLSYGNGYGNTYNSSFGPKSPVGESILYGHVADEVLDIVGTLGYVAPEVLSGKAYSYPADVFSFAMVAWEMFATDPNDNPIKGLSTDLAITRMEEGLRPVIESSHSSQLQELIKSSWDTIPSKRPMMSDIATALFASPENIPSKIKEDKVVKFRFKIKH